jgi:nicotinate-nucleotide adenylyltransferase
MRPIGIFGGTFDPIHYGHLRTALELKQTLDLEAVHFVPCASPPHRSAPLADGRLRLKMVEAAIRGERGFVADDRELRRPGLSYTVDTLMSFRSDLPDAPLCLLLGMDAFLGLPQWHRWRELFDVAHVVFAHRPGWLHVRPVTQLEISSTDLRDLLRAGRDPKFLVPDAVRQIILETECYAESL